MDMLDEIADAAQIGPDLLTVLRQRFGGQSHYIHSGRRLIHDQIRQSELPIAEIARRYGLHRGSVKRIKAR